MRHLLAFLIGFFFVYSLRATVPEEWPIDNYPSCWSYRNHFLKSGLMSLDWDMASEVCTDIDFTVSSYVSNYYLDNGATCVLRLCVHSGSKLTQQKALNWLRYSNGKSRSGYEGFYFTFGFDEYGVLSVIRKE